METRSGDRPEGKPSRRGVLALLSSLFLPIGLVSGTESRSPGPGATATNETVTGDPIEYGLGGYGLGGYGLGGYELDGYGLGGYGLDGYGT